MKIYRQVPTSSTRLQIWLFHVGPVTSASGCERQRNVSKCETHVRGVQSLCFCSSVKPIVYDALVALVLTLAQSPPHRVRKELSKMPREAVCSAVSSRVRGNFGEKLASRGREDKIKYVQYFCPREPNSSLCAAIVVIELSSVEQASNKIHGILTWHYWRRNFFLRRHLQPLKSREKAMYFNGA